MTGGLRPALGALLCGLAVVGTAGWRAIRLETSVAAAPISVPATPSAASVHLRARTEPGALQAAADRNLFHPQRIRGGIFRLPGDADPYEAPAPTPPPPTLRLLGTAVTATGQDFVVCAGDGHPARIVRLGERCGDLVLERVEQGRAQFGVSAGDPLVIEVPKPGES